MKPISALMFIAMLALVSPARASDSPNAAPNDVVSPWQLYSLEGALTELEVDYGLWLETTLSGVQPEVDRLEKAMLSLVNYDIYVSQEKVRALAKAAAVKSWQVKPDSLAQPTDEALDLQEAIGTLNAKESLYRSINKTKAFSNKYRLLGDYINLLRRELELPRLKLATEKVANPSPNDIGSSVPKQN